MRAYAGLRRILTSWGHIRMVYPHSLHRENYPWLDMASIRSVMSFRVLLHWSSGTFCCPRNDPASSISMTISIKTLIFRALPDFSLMLNHITSFRFLIYRTGSSHYHCLYTHCFMQACVEQRLPNLFATLSSSIHNLIASIKFK